MEQLPDYFEQNLESVSSADDRYVTEPITTVKSVEQQMSEEELHRLFEEAISDRVLVVSACLNRISQPLTFRSQITEDGRYSSSDESPSAANPLRVHGSVGRWFLQTRNPWQRVTILLSLALLLLMSGFDLMGVLVLYLR